MKVICISNRIRAGKKGTYDYLKVGQIYDVDEGRATSMGFGVPDLACGMTYPDNPDLIWDENNPEIYWKAHDEVTNYNNYYWVTLDSPQGSYQENLSKKFFITLAEYRNEKINEILE